MRRPQQYRVEIQYQEYMSGSPRTFNHSYEFAADSEDEARSRAVNHFHDTCAESSVAWARTIEDVKVLAAVPPESEEQVPSFVQKLKSAVMRLFGSG
jgi:hypothetical protein